MPASRRKIVISLDTYLSILAVVSSFCAIGITFYQAYLQRTQQYASVMPVLDGYTSNGSSDDGYRYDLIFVNNGVGPAFIKGYEYFYKKKRYDDFHSIVRQIGLDQAGAQNRMAFDTLPIKNIDFNNFWVNRIMPQNQEIKLVSIIDDSLARWVYEAYKRREINVKIRYASIYNEEWQFELRPEKIELQNQKVSN